MKKIVIYFQCITVINIFFVSVLALVVLFGWHFDCSIIINLFPNQQLSNPVTALCLLLSAISFLCISNSKNHTLFLGKFLAGIILVIGLIRFLETIIHYDSGIDRWLYKDKILIYGYNGMPNYMAPNTALSFLLFGCCLLLYRFRIKQKSLLTDYVASSVALISFVPILGFLYKAFNLYSVQSNIPMAFPTALSFFLLSTAVLLKRSSFGLFSVFTREYEGSRMACYLLPTTILLPTILEFFRFHGQKLGLYTLPVGIAIFDTINMIIFFYLIWHSAVLVNKKSKALSLEVKERSKSELEIQKNVKFLHGLIENLPDMILVKDADLKFVVVNKAAEKLLNVPRNKLLGKSNFDLFPAAQANFFSQMDLELIGQKKGIDIQEEQIAINGKPIWLLTKKIPIFDEEDKRIFLLGISQNITERKLKDEQLHQFNNELETKIKERTYELYKHEKLFRSLIENSIDVFSMRSKTGKLIYLSPSVEKMLGYTVDEIKEKGFLFIIANPADVDQYLKVFEQTIINPKIYHQYTLQVTTKGGNVIWVEGTLKNMLHEEDVNAVVTNFHDITERKLAEEAKLRFERQLDEEKSKQQILLIKASFDAQEKEKKEIGMELHDNINQILASTKLFLDMAKSNEEMRMEMIEKSIETVSTSIQEIRKLSKTLVPHGFEPQGMLGVISDLIHSIELTTNVKIKANICGTAINRLNDQQQIVIYRIIQEQFNNILKHAAANHIHIYVQERSDTFELLIIDDGKGFDVNNKKKGIGLSNIKSRTALLKGQLLIDSKIDQGCKLQITFPLTTSSSAH